MKPLVQLKQRVYLKQLVYHDAVLVDAEVLNVLVVVFHSFYV